MVYSSLFKNIIEALTLNLEKYLAEIQLPNLSFGFSSYHRVLAWLAIGDFHRII